MTRRTLDSQKFSANLRGDRAEVCDIREQPIRVGSGLGAGMSAWRGKSGKRWVATVREIKRCDAADLTDAVVLGIYRDEVGHARIVFATHSLSDEAAVRLLRTLRTDVVTEIHTHRLADTDAERDAMVADLTRTMEVA